MEATFPQRPTTVKPQADISHKEAELRRLQHEKIKLAVPDCDVEDFAKHLESAKLISSTSGVENSGEIERAFAEHRIGLGTSRVVSSNGQPLTKKEEGLVALTRIIFYMTVYEDLLANSNGINRFQNEKYAQIREEKLKNNFSQISHYSDFAQTPFHVFEDDHKLENVAACFSSKPETMLAYLKVRHENDYLQRDTWIANNNGSGAHTKGTGDNNCIVS